MRVAPMSIPLKSQVIALSIMCGTGVAAPAAAYVANQPVPRAEHARSQLDPVMDASEEALKEAPYIAVVERGEASSTLVLEPWQPPRWTSVSSKPIAMPNGQHSALPGLMGDNCFMHRSQTLAAGAIRVCDMKRSPNGQSRTLFAPIAKPRRLGLPRTFSSPTGLTR
jgi:hypothetical protein